MAGGYVYTTLLTLYIGLFQVATASTRDGALLSAAQRNDLPGVTSALENGANVDAQTVGGVTAVTFAVRNRNLPMVKLLIERHAHLWFQDAFLFRTAVDEAIALGDLEMVRYLNAQGAPSAEYILTFALDKKDLQLLRAVASRGDIPDFVIAATHALTVAKQETEAAAILAAEMGHRPAAQKSLLSLSTDALRRFTGKYRQMGTGQSIHITWEKDQMIAVVGPRSVMLYPFSETEFRAPEMPNTVFSFFPSGGQAERLIVLTGHDRLDLGREAN